MARLWKVSIVAILLGASAANGAPESKDRATQAAQICARAEVEAKANDLDPSFFARLLWRESLFDPNVVSNKGAQGIAQFMPETAARRGLKDPFEPIAAVQASAAYLSELRKQFGNLGLAAAAYNAGEDRVTRWLGDTTYLPEETQSYVSFITGHTAEEWKSATANFSIPAIGTAATFSENCVALAVRKQQLTGPHLASAPFAPWGALLAVNFNESTAVAMFKRLKLRFPKLLPNADPLILRKRNLSRGSRRLVYVMIAEKSRATATASCASLSAAGAPCIVRKN